MSYFLISPESHNLCLKSPLTFGLIQSDSDESPLNLSDVVHSNKHRHQSTHTQVHSVWHHVQIATPVTAGQLLVHFHTYFLKGCHCTISAITTTCLFYIIGYTAHSKTRIQF